MDKERKINRREFLSGLVFTVVLGKAGNVMAFDAFGKKKEKKKQFPYKLTEDEWREKLPPEAYHVMREAGTERAFTSPLNEEKRNGVFHCKGCDQELFSSAHKFDSGTGWPSFWQPIRAGSIGTNVDRKLFYARTEEHCSNCGSHLGHIFDDGPPPTGKRHCINGVVLVFKA